MMGLDHASSGKPRGGNMRRAPVIVTGIMGHPLSTATYTYIHIHTQDREIQINNTHVHTTAHTNAVREIHKRTSARETDEEVRITSPQPL
jgi:hypothetical protein